MEDQEPGDEGDAVHQEVGALNDDMLLEMGVAHRMRPDTREVRGHSQHNPHCQRYRPERQRLPEQVRLALALPGPPAQQIAHERSDHGRDDARGARAVQVDRPGQQAEDDLTRDYRSQGGSDEPDEPPSPLGSQPARDRRGQGAKRSLSDLVRNGSHQTPSLTGGAGLRQTGTSETDRYQST